MVPAQERARELFHKAQAVEHVVSIGLFWQASPFGAPTTRARARARARTHIS